MSTLKIIVECPATAGGYALSGFFVNNANLTCHSDDETCVSLPQASTDIQCMYGSLLGTYAYRALAPVVSQSIGEPALSTEDVGLLFSSVLLVWSIAWVFRQVIRQISNRR